MNDTYFSILPRDVLLALHRYTPSKFDIYIGILGYETFPAQLSAFYYENMRDVLKRFYGAKTSPIMWYNTRVWIGREELTLDTSIDVVRHKINKQNPVVVWKWVY